MGLLTFIRRNVLRLSVPGATPVPPLKPLDGRRDAAPELPVNIDPLTGVAWRKDRDIVIELTTDGYKLLRRSPIIFQPLWKAALRICALDLVAVCEDSPGCERQLEHQRILDQMPGRNNLVKWLMLYGYTEGVTFNQIKLARARHTGTDWFCPDVGDGGTHKQNAVESPNDAGLLWDRAIIAKRRTFAPFAPSEVNAPGTFRPEDFVVFSPGGSSNSEGNLHLARVLVPLAHQYEQFARDLEDFGHIFALPWAIWSGAIDGVQVDKVAELMQQGADALKGLNGQNPRFGAKMDKEKIALLEPQGTASRIIMDRMTHLEAQAHRIILGNDLTSSTKESGAAGSSDIHSQEEDKFIMSYARDIAEAIASALIPWIDRHNEDFPTLEKGCGEIYFRFQPEGRRAALGLPARSGAAEEVDIQDNAPEEGATGIRGNTEPDEEEAHEILNAESMRRPALLALSRTLRAIKKKCPHRHALELRSASDLTHPGCRCDIGPDNVWTDAGDARVCTICLTMGAAWNLQQDVPMDPAFIDEVLDARGRGEFRKALARDSALSDDVIRQAAEKAERGLIVREDLNPATTGQPGLLAPLSRTNAVERAIVRAANEARAQASVKVGARIPGTGAATQEAVSITKVGGRVKPEFISVEVAGDKDFKVVRRAGKYLVQTSDGKTRYADDNLALSLLLFALLVKKQEDLQKQRRERDAAKEQA
jgi:hypothetical protein